MTTWYDEAALRALQPEDILSYLTAHGWRTDETAENPTAHVVVHDGESSYPELLVPRNRSVFDYATRIAFILCILEDIEQRPRVEVFRDFTFAGVDVIRVRAAEVDVLRGSIGLNSGAELVEHAIAMMAAAASSTVKPKKVISKRPQAADDYLKCIELGQSERGSYVLTLVSPVKALLTQGSQEVEKFWDDPFPRQVTRTLSRALQETRDATTVVNAGAGIETFADKVNAGVSANLCDAIAGMLEQNPSNEDLSLTIAWAVGVPEEEDRPSAFKFAKTEAKILFDAARFLREEDPETQVALTGIVESLHRDQGAEEGRATIVCVVDGKVRKLRTDLSASDYDVAIVAHRSQEQVFFTVDVVRRGRNFHGENVHDFRKTDS